MTVAPSSEQHVGAAAGLTCSWGITYLPRCECDDAARRRGRRSEARADTLLERMYSRRGDRLPRHRWPMDDLVSLPKRRNRSQMHTGVMCLPGAQRDAIWATAPEIGCFLHRLRSRWGIRFTKAGETSELLADPVAPRHEDTRRYRSSYAGGTVVWRCAIERSWPRVAWVWLQRRGEVTVTGLQSPGSHHDVATRSREFLTAAAASWPSFSHACRRPLSPTPCLVFWLTTYRWHGSLLLSRTGTGTRPRHAEWHAFLSSHGTLLCHACLLCSALPAYWPGRWLGSRRF